MERTLFDEQVVIMLCQLFATNNLYRIAHDASLTSWLKLKIG